MPKQPLIIETINGKIVRIIREKPNSTPLIIKYRKENQKFIGHISVKNGKIEIKYKDILVLREDAYSLKPKVKWLVSVEKDTRVFGLGERGGHLNRWGSKIRISNEDPFIYYANPRHDPLYLSATFLIVSSRSYSLGILFNTSWTGEINLKRKGKIMFVFDGGNIDIFLILEDTVRDVLRSLAKIVGTQYLPPIWALGYHQSKWSYQSEGDIKELVKKFKMYDIPCSAVYLDLEYMSNKRVFTWSKRRFPNPRKLSEKLLEEGIHLVPIVDPFVVDSDYSIANHGKREKFFVTDEKGNYVRIPGWGGKSLLLDVVNPRALDWWSELYIKFSKKYLIDGFWNDMNEPSAVTLPLFSKVYMSKIHFNGGKRRYPLKAMKNIYALLQNKAIFEKFKAKNKRIFLLSRSGNVGIQRYAAIWTGDIWSSWDHLAQSIVMLLSLSLSGIPFVGADIGGFMPPLVKTSAELYIRWIQLGTFYPLMRAHSCIYKGPNEPWRFGKRALSIAREFIRLRYRLLPYIYTQFYFAHKFGDPVMRPLFYEFPEDKITYDIEHEFMFGDSMLIAPILKPKPKKWRIYLPNNTWIDFWTNKVYNGRKILEITPELDKIPVFIRYNRIIPMRRSYSQKVDLFNEPIELYIYGEKARGQLYVDDGETFNYEKGNYTLLEFLFDGEKLHITNEKGIELLSIKPEKVSSDVWISTIGIKNLAQGNY